MLVDDGELQVVDDSLIVFFYTPVKGLVHDPFAHLSIFKCVKYVGDILSHLLQVQKPANLDFTWLLHPKSEQPKQCFPDAFPKLCQLQQIN